MDCTSLSPQTVRAFVYTEPRVSSLETYGALCSILLSYHMDWSPQVDAEETGVKEHRHPSLVLILGEAVHSVKCDSNYRSCFNKICSLLA